MPLPIASTASIFGSDAPHETAAHAPRDTNLVRSIKILTLLFAALIIGSAALLAYSVSEGIKPVDRTQLVDLYTGKLPPLPRAGLPGAVEPDEELLPVNAQTAQEINASRPFSTAKVQLAAPFAYSLMGDDEERAVACLATAALYEAGGSSSDQSAVIQVILNRVRHPAFPSTACGVVFQGSERRTGCQFSFTCDGSMLRWRPAPSAWRGAAALARSMLRGHVDGRVGLATHYHTDWVVPYWSASLEKVTSVRTHLFFRWSGFWGTSAAFRQRPAQREPVIAALGGLFPAHGILAVNDGTVADASGETFTDAGETMAQTEATTPAIITEELPIRRLALSPNTGAARWAVNALAMCNDVPVCRVVGWSEPASEPASIDRASLMQSPPDLIFVKISRNRQQQAFWDCRKWGRVSGSQCLGSESEVGRLLYAD